MTRVISSSWLDAAAEIAVSASKIRRIRIKCGGRNIDYGPEHIAAIAAIDADQFRSAGGAAAGAIIGGVLTGGIGLIAGAAIGGRRQKAASYLIHFTDGHHIAIQETAKANWKVLDNEVMKARIAGMVPPPGTAIPADLVDAVAPPRVAQQSTKLASYFVGVGICLAVALVAGFLSSDPVIAIMTGVALTALWTIAYPIFLISRAAYRSIGAKPERPLRDARRAAQAPERRAGSASPWR